MVKGAAALRRQGVDTIGRVAAAIADEQERAAHRRLFGLMAGHRLGKWVIG